MSKDKLDALLGLVATKRPSVSRPNTRMLGVPDLCHRQIRWNRKSASYVGFADAASVAS